MNIIKRNLIIGKAVKWMVSIANDKAHGYDKAKRNGPNYDCSSLCNAGWEKAGVPVTSKGGACTTSNIKKAYLANGFELVKIDTKTGKGMKKGDVLLHEGHHVATAISSKQIVHASINELGKTTGGKSGDQTGKEICVRDYYNHPWNCVLRFVGK